MVYCLALLFGLKGFIVWPKRLVFDTAQEAQEAQPPILLPQVLKLSMN